MPEPAIIKKIEKAGLIGRGCNNFPTARKWRLVWRAKAKKEKFVVCNVSESEPGVFKDHYILVNWPERVIEGVRIAMRALGAQHGFIYLKPEYFEEFQERLNKFIKAAHAKIELFQKPEHDYIGGEESAVLNSMEGRRVEPRLKPPYPTAHGFFQEPTLVNNCETFYAVSLINKGEYRGQRFYSFSGDGLLGSSSRDAWQCVSTNQDITASYPSLTPPLAGNIQGIVRELPVDITVKSALASIGHQPSDRYFYQVGGGAAGYCYNHQQLARPFEGLAAVRIYDKKRSEKEVVLGWTDFFASESCGQCVPCREGTYRLRDMLEKFYLAKRSYNEQALADLIFTLQNTSFCPLGRVSANAILSYWQNVKY